MSPQGHYPNLRERFLQNEINGFLDYEVLELLLKLADNRRDQKSTAKLLIKEFRTFRAVLEASPQRLKKVDGIGLANIFGLQAIHAVSQRYLKSKFLQNDFIKSSEFMI